MTTSTGPGGVTALLPHTRSSSSTARGSDSLYRPRADTNIVKPQGRRKELTWHNC